MLPEAVAEDRPTEREPVAPPPEPAREDALESVAFQAARGNGAAIRQLFTALAPALLRAARGVLGPSHPELDDVVQMALLRTLKALPAFRGECKVSHFASRIGVRTAIDHARQLSAQRRAEEESLTREDATQPMHASEPGQRLLARLLLHELTDVQAETLVLRSVFGCTIAEVAQATGAPENTVRSRLRLAKAALRRRLDGDPGMAALIRGDE